MKLIYCVNCDDIFNPFVRSVCACGLSTTTIYDKVVIYRGEYAFPVELDGKSMGVSLEYYRHTGVMTRFSGWFPSAESGLFRKE